MLFASDPRIMPIRAVSMLYPSAYGALPPGPPAKGEALCNLSIGFVLRGGPTRTLKGHGRPSLENKPINGFQGPLPLAEVEDWAAKSGPMSLLVGLGAKPRSLTGPPDCSEGPGCQPGRSGRDFALAQQAPSGNQGLAMATHQIAASPQTVRWGTFSADYPALITINSGDTVVLECVSGAPEVMPPPGSLYSD